MGIEEGFINFKKMEKNILLFVGLLLCFVGSASAKNVTCFSCVHDGFYNRTTNLDCIDPTQDKLCDPSTEVCDYWSSIRALPCRPDYVCLKSVHDYERENADGVMVAVHSISRTCIRKGVLTNDETITDQCSSSTMWGRTRHQCVCDTDFGNSTTAIQANMLALVICAFFLPYLSKQI